ncbi:MAG: hypothetical protein VKJ27_08595 [Synechocystis sp.]|nr:hypothetical protein [Synechocystis sp.]
MAPCVADLCPIAENSLGKTKRGCHGRGESRGKIVKKHEAFPDL